MDPAPADDRPAQRPDRAPADAEARFEALALQVTDPVRRYLARRTDHATADELLNETLVVCWRRLHEVPADGAVPWSIGVARNCLTNAVRADTRRWRLSRRIAVVDPPPPSTAGPGGVHDPAADRVTAAMARLGPQDAEVLRLWAWEELAPAQIAEVLQISANAATVRLHRARKRLRAQLDRVGSAGTDEPEGGGRP